MKNSINKLRILHENANNDGNPPLKEYIANVSETDPNFFRWLFDEDFDEDFDTSLSDEQRKEYNDWLESITE